MRLQFWVVTLVFIVLSASAKAQDITLEKLQGSFIDLKMTYRGMSRIPGKGTAPNTIYMTSRIKIGPGEQIEAKAVRNVVAETPAGTKRGSLSFNFSGRIGTPATAADGSRLWLLDGNQLILLRVMETGGFKYTIKIVDAGGTLTCTVEAPYAAEKGAGAGRTKSALHGGKVEIISLKQTAGTCKITRS